MNETQIPPFYQLNSDDQAGILVFTTVALGIICIIAIAAKLFLSFRRKIFPLRDFDYALLAGTALLLVQSGLLVHAARLGLGKHSDTLDSGALDLIRKLQYAAGLLSIAVVACTKLCMCLLVTAINNYGRVRIATKSLIGLIVVFFVSSLLARSFACSLPTPWLASALDCPAIQPIYTYSLVTNSITDVLICALVLIMVWSVQMGVKTKLLVVALFSFRIICPCTLIPAIRNTSHLYNDTTDFTWLAVTPLIWLEVSDNFSVITACIPSLMGIFDIWLGNTMAINIDVPYEMKPTSNKSGFEVTARDTSGPQSTSRSGARSRTGRSSEGLKLTPSIANQAQCLSDGNQYRNKNRDSEIPKSDSVQNLTEDAIMVREDVEIHFSEPGARRESSPESSVGQSSSPEAVSVKKNFWIF